LLKQPTPDLLDTQFPAGTRTWLLAILAWQATGIAATVVVSLPVGNFHRFLHWVIIGLTFTGGVGLLAGGGALAHRAGWRPASRAGRLALLTAGLALVVAISAKAALVVGRFVCGLDSFQVDRWHLLIVAINLILLTATAVAAALLAAYRNVSADLERRIRDNERLERLQIETQLRMLESKINPHFLFNTLNTMLDLVREKPAQVESMILNLSDIYRKILTWPEAARVSLGDELKLVRDYLEIEKIRMGARLQYCIEVAEGSGAVEIPPMIVEILVENAVLHGLSRRKSGGAIHVAVRKEGELLRIEVRDDGVGLGHSQPGIGFGIHSVRERLRLTYGPAARLALEEISSGGTQATIELPYAD